MKLFLLLLSIVSIFVIINTDHYIINGKPAKEGQFPSIVIICAKVDPKGIASIFCGGTLISHLFVLTAAHCVIEKGLIKLLPGVIQYNDSLVFASKFSPKRVIVHPKYKKGYVSYDVALIELSTPVDCSDKVYPARLPTAPPNVGDWIDVAGWGSNTTDGLLLYTSLRVMSSTNDCMLEQLEDEVIENKDSMVCLNATNSTQCMGDSGGPYYLKDTNILVGVVGFGYKSLKSFCPLNSPNVGASVYYYLNWIHKHICIN